MQKTINFNNNSDQQTNWNNTESKYSSIQNKVNLPIAILIIFLVVIAVGAIIYALTLKAKNDSISLDLSGQTTQMQIEAKKYLDELKNILLIDTEESPVIAKVADPDKLKTSNAEFYKNVQKDDIVYIFSYRIIIYRESENKIINIAPIINTQIQNSASATSQAKTATTSSKK